MHLGFPCLSFDFCVSLDLCVLPSGLESDDISQNPHPTFSEVDGQWPLIQEGFPLTTLKKGVFFQILYVLLRYLCRSRISSEFLFPFFKFLVLAIIVTRHSEMHICGLFAALADVQTSFCALADLSAESRSSILLLLREILTDRSVLSALVDRVSNSIRNNAC